MLIRRVPRRDRLAAVVLAAAMIAACGKKQPRSPPGAATGYDDRAWSGPADTHAA